MQWTFIYLMVFLKLPIAALGYIVWRAVRDVPEPDEQTGPDNGGGSKTGRVHPRKPFPRSPRRGPHGDPAAPPPPRFRSTVAKARHIDRS